MNVAVTNKDAARDGRPLSRRQKQRYAAILDAIMTLMNDRGFDHVSIRDVAELADVAPATLYNVFGSKENVFAAAVERQTRMFSIKSRAEISATGFLGLIEINKRVAEFSLASETFSRSVATIIHRDSRYFGVREIYAAFHGRFIDQIRDMGDMVGQARPDALTYLLMLQNNATLAAWATGEIPSDKLAATFDLVACNTLHHSTRNKTRNLIDACYENRIADFKTIDWSGFFKQTWEFPKFKIVDLIDDATVK